MKRKIFNIISHLGNKITMRCHYKCITIAKIKNGGNNQCKSGEDAEKLDLSCHSGKQFDSFLQNLVCTYHTTQQSQSWNLSQRCENFIYKNLYTNVHSSFIHK